MRCGTRLWQRGVHTTCRKHSHDAVNGPLPEPAGIHSRGGEFAPHRLDCGLRRQAKADAVGDTTSIGVRLGVVLVRQCVLGRRY